MKKYLIGFMAGVLLMFSTSVLAEGISKIGKRIEAEFSVQLDGEELPFKAIALEGTSYAPVRSVAEALGLEVDFVDKVVVLNSKQPKEADLVKELKEELRDVSNLAADESLKLSLLKSNLSRAKFNDESDDVIAEIESEITATEEKLAEYVAKQKELQRQLDIETGTVESIERKLSVKDIEIRRAERMVERVRGNLQFAKESDQSEDWIKKYETDLANAEAVLAEHLDEKAFLEDLLEQLKQKEAAE